MTAPSRALQWLAMKIAAPGRCMNRSRWLTDSLAKLFRPGKRSVFCRSEPARRQDFCLVLCGWPAVVPHTEARQAKTASTILAFAAGLAGLCPAMTCLQRYVSVLSRRALDRLAQAKLE